MERRKKRDLPKVVLDYLDETASFSEAFREELKEEEEFSKRELEPLEVKIKRVISELTYYTNLIENDEGRVFIVCNKCNHIYCEAKENFKLYCLIYEHDPGEIHQGELAPSKDWAVYREFYCPGCGTQVEVEATPPGTPILQNYQVRI